MNNQSDNTVRKTINPIIKSLVTGLLSLLIYAAGLSLVYEVGDAWEAVAFITGVSGITLCLISFNAGNEAIKQLKENNNVERNYGIAIAAGRVLGILGVLASIFFCVLVFYGLLAQ